MSKIKSSLALAALATGLVTSAWAQGAASLSGSVDRANAPSAASSSAEGWFSTEPGSPSAPASLRTGGTGPATAVRPLPDTSGSGNPSPDAGSDTGAGTGIGAGIGSDTSGGVAGTTTGIGAGVGSDRAPTARNGTGTGVGSSPSSTGVGSAGAGGGGGAAGSR